MTELGQIPGDARKRKAERDVVSIQIGGRKFVPEGSPPTAPRVARSVDDLRVGQWIATRGDDGWETRTVCDSLISVPYWDFDGDRVVILSDAPDPPARDWLVPATQMEALREAQRQLQEANRKRRDDATPLNESRVDAAMDLYALAATELLDAAREVEHE